MKHLITIFMLLFAGATIQCYAHQSHHCSQDSVPKKGRVMPEFPGGPKAMMEYLVVYVSADTHGGGIRGRVVIECMIQPDGSVSDVKVIRKVDPRVDAEAVKLVENMPRWSPAMKDGQAVAMPYTLPVMIREKRD